MTDESKLAVARAVLFVVSIGLLMYGFFTVLGGIERIWGASGKLLFAGAFSMLMGLQGLRR